MWECSVSHSFVLTFHVVPLSLGAFLGALVFFKHSRYRTNLQSLLRELGVLKTNFGKVFSNSLSANVRPAVAGFQLTPYVRASDINFDHDVPSTEKGKEQGNVTKITGALVVGMEYAVRGSAGSVAEVAFTPTTSLCGGLDPDTLTPTVYVKCLLGSCLLGESLLHRCVWVSLIRLYVSLRRWDPRSIRTHIISIDTWADIVALS